MQIIQAGEFERGGGGRRKSVFLRKRQIASIQFQAKHLQEVCYSRVSWILLIELSHLINNTNRKVCTESCFVTEAFQCTRKNCSILAT